MEYDELIDKIKDALKSPNSKFTKRRIYKPFSKRLGWTDTKRDLTKRKKTEKEISIIELKRLTNGFWCDIICL